MDRGTYLFQAWCATATGKIGYGPDREKVFEELQAHWEDHRDALLAQGLPQEEADRLSLEAMGDAEEVASQLEAVHRPFWGYLLRGSKIALVILLVISLIPIWNYFSKICRFEDPSSVLPFAVYDTASYTQDTGRTLHHLSEPRESITADGYRFTVTDAAVYSTYSENTGAEVTTLSLSIKQRSLMPWTETAGYYNFYAADSVFREFTARDSLGNFYYSSQASLDGDPVVGMWATQTGVFTATLRVRINDFPKDAEWVELCYERDGRQLYLHIDLTGGAGE